MQTNALNFECLRDKGFLPFSKVNHLENCVLFYAGIPKKLFELHFIL